MKKKKILIIRHGALGDFILSFGPFQTIRKAWPEAEITLLTTKPYVELAQKSGLFNTLWIDDRPKFWELRKLLSLRKKLLYPHFNWVYDLQTSSRSSFYIKFFWTGNQKINWSGIATGCSHPDSNPDRSVIHTIERQKNQLLLSGLDTYISGDFSFLKASIKPFNIKKPYILIVPGSSPHRQEKRWPHYIKLASTLAENGYTCVALGTQKEAPLLRELETKLLKKQQTSFINLAGKTSFDHIAELARHAAGAVGNDTGPMHLIAAVNCPSLVLFSKNSNPVRCAPRGKVVQIIQQDTIKNLSSTEVWDTLKGLVRK